MPNGCASARSTAPSSSSVQRRSSAPRATPKRWTEVIFVGPHTTSPPRASNELRTMHQDLVGELRAPGHCGVGLVGGNFADLLAFGEGHLARQLDIELAGRRTDQLHRRRLVESEVDKDGRIVDLDPELLGL